MNQTKFGTYLSHPGSQGCDRASRHGCLLSRTYNDFEVPRYFKSRVALPPEEICHVVRISPENFERNMFRIIQKKTGNKAIVDIDKYAIIPRLTYRLLKK